MTEIVDRLFPEISTGYDFYGGYLANQAVLDEVAKLHPAERRLITDWAFYDPDEILNDDLFDEFGNPQLPPADYLHKIAEGMAFYFLKSRYPRNYFPLLVENLDANSIIETDSIMLGPYYGEAGDDDTLVWVLSPISSTDRWESEAWICALRERYREAGGSVKFSMSRDTADMIYGDYILSLSY